MQGNDVRIANCSVHDKREVVGEVKLLNGQVILLCYPIVRDTLRRLEKKYQELGDIAEGDRHPQIKGVA